MIPEQQLSTSKQLTVQLEAAFAAHVVASKRYKHVRALVSGNKTISPWMVKAYNTAHERYASTWTTLQEANHAAKQHLNKKNTINTNTPTSRSGYGKEMTEQVGGTTARAHHKKALLHSSTMSRPPRHPMIRSGRQRLQTIQE
jgi:hypothetical protein